MRRAGSGCTAYQRQLVVPHTTVSFSGLLSLSVLPFTQAILLFLRVLRGDTSLPLVTTLHDN